MLVSRTMSRKLVAFAVALVLGLSAAPAFAVTTPAVPRGPVASGAVFDGTPLAGMSEDDARALIASGSSVPSLTPVIVKGDGRTFSFPATAAVTVNVNAMLNQAYASTDTAPFDIIRSYSVSSTVVSRWVRTIVKKIDRRAVSAKRSIKSRKLVVSAEKTGRKVDQKVTAARIKARLVSEATSSGVAPPAVKVAYKVLRPAVTRANIGKAILVVLGRRRVYLYKNTKVEKSYRCAIGMAAYPTPVGSFKVTGKAKNPTWRNPGSAWARNMPAYLTGSASPLGTRAIYLSASGIRLHGTTKTWSIGHAASHGCLRMLRHDIEDLYPRVPVGIKVYIVR